MAEENEQTTLVALGVESDCKKLFTKINDLFRIDKKYKNTLNKLNIIDTNDRISDAKFKMEITTKYYDLTIIIIVINPKNIDIEVLNKKLENSEGVLMFLNKENSSLYDMDQLSSFFTKLNEKENSFKSLILDENEVTSNERSDDLLSKIRAKIDEIEELVTINQYSDLSDDKKEDEEDKYTDLDELINCIFVHSWSNIELKSEKNEAVSLKKINLEPNEPKKTESPIDEKTEKSTENESEDKDAFNFEDMLMNLSDYKSKASGLEFEDRKKFAEDIVLKFWNAISGDKDEISGLGDL